MSAPLLTGKNRRRALTALCAAPLVALGIAAGSGTAHADSSTFYPAEVHLSNGYCSVSGWPGGTIFCTTSSGVNFPNGTQEIFGIGTNYAVWTDYGTEAHASGWQSMGAPSGGCDPGKGHLPVANEGNYALILGCYDNYGDVPWTKDRSAGVSGGWSAWISGA